MDFLDSLSEESITRFKEHGVFTNEELIDYIRSIEDRSVLKEHFLMNEEILTEIEKHPDYRSNSENRSLTQFGFKFDDEDDDLLYGKSEGSSEKKKLSLPSEIDHSSNFPPPKSQGKAGTCVAWACAHQLEERLGFDRELSRRYSYYNSKQRDNSSSEGTYISTCYQGIFEEGICEEKYWPYNDHNTLEKPSEEAFSRAKQIQLISYKESEGYSIDEWLKGCLSGALFSEPIMVTIGVRVFRGLWSNDTAWRKGKIMDPPPGAKAKSGHAICFVGYKDDPNYPGGGYFIFINSWGTKWGYDTEYCPEGFGIISYNYVRKHFGQAYAGISINDLTPESEIVQDSESEKKVEQPHMVYTGTTGAGKTFELKKDILRSRNKQFFITDLQGDISDDEEFVSKTEAVVWDVVKYGLPYNILDNRFRESSWNADTNRDEYAQFLLSLIKVVVTGLGGRQSNLLLKIVSDLIYAYETYDNVDYQLSDVMRLLETIASSKGNEARIASSLLDRLNPFFKTGVFDCMKETALTEMLESNKSVIFKCKFSNRDPDRLKLLSIFIITYLFRLFKVDNPKMNKVIVQDEFHLMAKAPIFDEIVREGRKYGAELWAVSQNIEDVLHILPNVGHRKVFHSNSGKEIRKVANATTYNKDDKEKVFECFKKLKPFEHFDPLHI